jgi:23S rRNA pseudouridine1911/1915/1917 synthase
MRRELLTERQMLHASDVTFRHPRTGETLTLSAPLPPDMREFLSAAGLADTMRRL